MNLRVVVVLVLCGCLAPVTESASGGGGAVTGGGVATGGGSATGGGGGMACGAPIGGGGPTPACGGGTGTGGGGGGSVTQGDLCFVSNNGQCRYELADGGLPQPGWCGSQQISPGCMCGYNPVTHDVMPMCTGGCLPEPVRLCSVTNCGTANCVTGAACVGPNTCGICAADEFVNEDWRAQGEASVAICQKLPAACTGAPSCDCLLKNGPWIDVDLAADAGIAWPITTPIPGKSICSYRVSCTTRGSVLELTCIES